MIGYECWNIVSDRKNRSECWTPVTIFILFKRKALIMFGSFRNRL